MPSGVEFCLSIPMYSHILAKYIFYIVSNKQSGRSPKVVALFPATNFSSYIIELFQLHDTIQIK